jgi:hypothetical protein
MSERELSAVETKEIYEAIHASKIQPVSQEVVDKCGEACFELNGKQYRLIYDTNFDWFCDIIFETTP